MKVFGVAFWLALAAIGSWLSFSYLASPILAVAGALVAIAFAATSIDT